MKTKSMQINEQDVLLFQGDSITHAFRHPEERSSSSRMGCGWAMILAAEWEATFPERGLRFENRGECGHGICGLLGRWERDCIALKPTVLNILVGVNDTIGTFQWQMSCPPALFESKYRELLEWTRRELPELRMILCEPFLLETGEVTAKWREDLAPRQETVRRLAEETGAVFVPFQAAFDQAAARTKADYWLFDGIHPNASGQWLMAQTWKRHVFGSTGEAGAL